LPQRRPESSKKILVKAAPESVYLRIALWLQLAVFYKGQIHMLSYATIGVNDLTKARTFYTELLADLGAKPLLEMDRIIFFGKNMAKPMLAICIPFNKEPAHPGNGTMVAISPGNKAAVDELYHKALSLGASCDGAPGQRIPDMFYGAYIRDLDGNKIAFTHFG
jgi:predicted lactoylglutathione lyase